MFILQPSSDGQSQAMPDGLVTGHAYSVTDLREVNIYGIRSTLTEP